ncbi:MAG: Putative oxidoreductase SMc00968 [uncultured Paraburkholderia sp.]|nr:MAG: Putative oxidoreductase SMc00968 [uncultured Paraburkholderia sp.]
MKNKALVYRSFGMPEDALSLETRVVDDLSCGYMRVHMELSPINPSDLIPITGAYRHRVTPPLVAGYEGLGIVTSVDHSTGFIPGQRVLPLRREGTWQQFVACDPKWTIAVPDDIDDSTAARAYINPLAAMLMLKRWDPSGRRVLVTAAGSSCANLLAQWAFAGGAREVSGIYRSSEHRAFLEQIGVRPLAMADAYEVARQIVAVDLVFDAVGGALASTILNGMRKNATFVSYGLLSGDAFTTPLDGPVPKRFHIRDQFSNLTSTVWRGWFDEIWQRLRQTPLPDVQRFPLEKWRKALALYRQPGRNVKPILCFAN